MQTFFWINVELEYAINDLIAVKGQERFGPYITLTEAVNILFEYVSKHVSNKRSATIVEALQQSTGEEILEEKIKEIYE